MSMRRMLLIFVIMFVGVANAATNTGGFSCGAGYVLESRRNIDGIDAKECQKLWCYDLETGKAMGNGATAYSGYQSTKYPRELTVGRDTITCWGERKWCSGQPQGDWDGDFGAYIRDGGANAYESYLKGGCFTWRLREHQCPAGTTAFLNANGEWECGTESMDSNNTRGSAIRRSSAPRRVLKK